MRRHTIAPRAPFLVALALAFSGLLIAEDKAKDKSKKKEPKSALDFTMKDIDGKDVNLAKLRGHVIMVVNVASK